MLHLLEHVATVTKMKGQDSIQKRIRRLNVREAFMLFLASSKQLSNLNPTLADEVSLQFGIYRFPAIPCCEE